MTANLKPYAEYKNSNLPWLGQVPKHWHLRPAFGAFVPIHEKNRGMKEKTVLSLSYGRIVVKPTEKLHGLVPESFETYQIVNPGDIILRTTDLQNDHTSVRVGMVKNRGIITSAYLALHVAHDLLPDFGFQFLNVWDSTKAIYGYGSGLRQGLDFSHFKRMPVAVPPLDEQAAIVRFLDWANGRLERAIRAKRKVIALLNEQKQAIIHRAVTRGLDPSVALKPSGIPWLGDIPQHWELIAARYLFRSVARRDIRGDEPKMSVTQKHGLVPTAEMSENSTQASSFERFQLCHPGDLVLNKYKAHLGVFWAAAARGLITPNYTVFRPARNVSTKFFEHLFHTQSYRDAFSMVVYGVIAGMCPLYTKDFYRIPCVYPPPDEQRSICEALIGMTKNEDLAITRLESEIEFLHEYRTRLIADVVTGQLDVREAAARLPDDAAFEAPEDDTDLSDETDIADEEEATA